MLFSFLNFKKTGSTFRHFLPSPRYNFFYWLDFYPLVMVVVVVVLVVANTYEQLWTVWTVSATSRVCPMMNKGTRRPPKLQVRSCFHNDYWYSTWPLSLIASSFPKTKIESSWVRIVVVFAQKIKNVPVHYKVAVAVWKVNKTRTTKKIS